MLPHSWLGPNSTRINRRQQRLETAHNSIPEADNNPPLLPVRTVDNNDTSDSDDEYYCDGLDEDLDEDYDDGDCVLDLAELAAQVIDFFFKVSFVMMMFSQKILLSFTWFQITKITTGYGTGTSLFLFLHNHML
jgi:hypothetical protein